MAPAGIEPMLFLDAYQCHMMASMVNVIQDMGVQVEHIPSGCTGLCQPIDVGIGKPLRIMYGICGKTGWSNKVKWYNSPLHRDKLLQAG